MMRFSYIVNVECDTKEQADRVMLERTGYDERYYQSPDGEWWSDGYMPADATSFDYSIDFTDPVIVLEP